VLWRRAEACRHATAGFLICVWELQLDLLPLHRQGGRGAGALRRVEAPLEAVLAALDQSNLATTSVYLRQQEGPLLGKAVVEFDTGSHGPHAWVAFEGMSRSLSALSISFGGSAASADT
jgi:hypothetical protein